MSRMTFLSTAVALLSLILAGCPSNAPQGGGGGMGTGGGTGKGDGSGGGKGGQEIPTFSLAWSEYPSWSAFDVASTNQIIDGAKGKLGPIEKKWGVDIELMQLDYDPCIASYGSGVCDAVCITNTDILSASGGRDSVAILPTSTSDGADACLVVGIDDVTQLKNYPTRGLEKSVSEYCFFRCLEQLGEKPEDFQFSNSAPDAAATAMQGGQAGYESIQVWNPFVLQTLRTVQGSKVLFDSTQIPGEIIDMVVVAKSSLDKPGGNDFACAVIDAYYELNKLLKDEKHADETLVEIGRKFANLGLEDMKVVVEQTKFYGTVDEGLEVFEKTLPKTMPTVVDFCVKRGFIEDKPKYSFRAPGEDNEGGQLVFDSSYMATVKKGK
ncbi:MAG: hypothetical protein AB7O62_14945 [Pirellulales bacterium]